VTSRKLLYLGVSLSYRYEFSTGTIVIFIKIIRVQGSVEQRRFVVGFNRLVSIVLLARRSRHFAGTRYNKRGHNVRDQYFPH
jgi:hypothetical protein